MDLRVIDTGGARSERKKWIHAFKEVDMILFTVDIGSYSQQLREDETVDRMQEALSLFDAIVNSRWFTDTEFVLCFTKQAKFAAKVGRYPLENYFPDFEADDHNYVESAILYIEDRFTSLNSTSKFIHTMVIPDLPTREDWTFIKDICSKTNRRKVG